MSFKQNFQLEEENYYEKELAFQDEITGENNYNLLKGETQILANQQLEISLPSDLVLNQTKVNVELKRPSNSNFDKKYVFFLDLSKIQEIIQFLLKLPFPIKETIYLEGGPETSFYVNIGNTKIEKILLKFA